jgi:hypothetical protein
MPEFKGKQALIVKDDKLSGPGSIIFKFNDNPPAVSESVLLAYQKLATMVKKYKEDMKRKSLHGE